MLTYVLDQSPTSGNLQHGATNGLPSHSYDCTTFFVTSAAPIAKALSALFASPLDVIFAIEEHKCPF